MELKLLSRNELMKAFGVGLATALILSAIMVPALLTGLSPLPKPPSLAFAETLFGTDLPLPVGLLFHVAYVTAWSVIFVALSRDRLTFRRAALLALILWIVALAVFFPIVGWGFFGLAIGPQLIAAAFVPHALFAVVLWGLCRAAFGDRAAGG